MIEIVSRYENMIGAGWMAMVVFGIFIIPASMVSVLLTLMMMAASSASIVVAVFAHARLNRIREFSSELHEEVHWRTR